MKRFSKSGATGVREDDKQAKNEKRFSKSEATGVREDDKQAKNEKLSMFAYSLKRSEIFSNSSLAFLHALKPRFSRIFAPAATVVTKENEEEDDLFYLVKGEVDVMVFDAMNNQPTLVTTLYPGATFGEIALMVEEVEGKCAATIRAKTDCHFLVINRIEFFSLLDKFPKEQDAMIDIATRRGEEWKAVKKGTSTA